MTNDYNEHFKNISNSNDRFHLSNKFLDTQLKVLESLKDVFVQYHYFNECNIYFKEVTKYEDMQQAMDVIMVFSGYIYDEFIEISIPVALRNYNQKKYLNFTFRNNSSDARELDKLIAKERPKYYLFTWMTSPDDYENDDYFYAILDVDYFVEALPMYKIDTIQTSPDARFDRIKQHELLQSGCVLDYKLWR